MAHPTVGVIVNTNEARFVNRGVNYKVISQIAMKQPSHLTFQIFDQMRLERSQPEPTPIDLEAGLARGDILQADTLALLADRIGLDPAAVAATVARYNNFADAGRDDDFGRVIPVFGSASPRIDTAPFYAAPTTVALTTTYCGLKVDGDMGVVNVFGEPIAGLYAAGEIIGGFHGQS